MASSSTEGSKYVTLVSNDGFEFVVLREATLVSPALKSMLDPSHQFVEARTGRCEFQEIRYVVGASDGVAFPFGNQLVVCHT